MNNQKGNMTLAGALMIFSISAWSLLYLQKEKANFYELKSRLGSFTCMKTLNGEVKTHVRWMERLNKLIEVADAVIVASVAAPPVIAAAKASKKAAQTGQQAKHFSYLIKLASLTKNRCLFDPSTYTTPYKNKGLLSRDSLGRAMLRKRSWSQTTIGKQVILKTKVEKEGLWKTKMESESWEIQEGLSLLKQL